MEVFIGTIMQFGFNFPPRGWTTCSGQIMSIAQNQALFSLIGTIYGGNGTTTFQLPDLRGRAAIGQGQGLGLTMRNIGEIGGTENVTLTTAQMPAHTHVATFTPSGGGGPISVTVKASANQATQSIPGTGGANVLGAPYYADGPGAVNGYVADANPGVTLGGVTATGGGGSGTVTNANTGNSLPFPIMQPFLTINYSIALGGIFPSRN